MTTENNNTNNYNNNNIERTEKEENFTATAPTTLELHQQHQCCIIIDPIQLFGIPPPALRVAQTHSRLSLAYYIEAANLIQRMNHIMINNNNISNDSKK